MSVAERVADGWNGFLGRIRHPEAARVTTGSSGDFTELEGHKHCLVVTFRRSGEAVPTPVWFGLADGKVYLRSEKRVGKIKRIRATPRVLVAPCDSRGKPLGEAVEGRARILTASEEPRAEAAIQSNFGLGRRMYERVAMSLGPEGVYVEVAPAAKASETAPEQAGQVSPGAAR
jgi:PPOX class probable F420-dependent enzyme